MATSKALVTLLVASSMLVGAAGVLVSHKAIAQTKKAYQLAAQSDQERRAIEKELGITREKVKQLEAAKTNKVGAAGTLSRANCNIFNVKRLSGHQKWKGQVGIDKFGHVIFSAPEYSVRAAAMVLKNYYQKHGCNTVEKIVCRFSTNNHAEYTAYLCKRLNLKPDQKFNVLKRLPELLTAMAKFESGASIPDRYLASIDLIPVVTED